MARTELRDPDGRSWDLRVNIPGRHNLLNAAAAFAAATQGLGQDPAQVLEGLFSFTGTRRRFEPKGTAAGVELAQRAGVSSLIRTARCWPAGRPSGAAS